MSMFFYMFPGSTLSLSAQNSLTNCWLELGMTNDIALVTICDTGTNALGVHDLFFSTNFADPDAWEPFARCVPGQTNLAVSNLPPVQGFFSLGIIDAIRPGFTNFALPPEDDEPSTNVSLPFTLVFYSSTNTIVYVNNNGNVTFDQAQSAYNPSALVSLAAQIIAPYWADVDTRNPASALVTFGTETVDDRQAFGVDWVNVGYYAINADRFLSCQLVIIDRSDIAPGDFDMEFNYFRIQWQWGDASTGYAPRAGFSDGINSFELPGSGIADSFDDSNPVTGLIYNSLNSTIPGRYVFHFRNGSPVQ